MTTLTEGSCKVRNKRNVKNYLFHVYRCINHTIFIHVIIYILCGNMNQKCTTENLEIDHSSVIRICVVYVCFASSQTVISPCITGWNYRVLRKQRHRNFVMSTAVLISGVISVTRGKYSDNWH